MQRCQYHRIFALLGVRGNASVRQGFSKDRQGSACVLGPNRPSVARIVSRLKLSSVSEGSQNSSMHPSVARVSAFAIRFVQNCITMTTWVPLPVNSASKVSKLLAPPEALIG